MLVRRRFVSHTLSLTPLIDVIFLLLLFFMLSSTFSQFGEISLSGASSGNMTRKMAKVFLHIKPDEVTLNNTPIHLINLERQLRKLDRRQNHQEFMLLVSLTNDATAQQLVDTLVQTDSFDDLSIVFLQGR